MAPAAAALAIRRAVPRRLSLRNPCVSAARPRSRSVLLPWRRLSSTSSASSTSSTSSASSTSSTSPISPSSTPSPSSSAVLERYHSRLAAKAQQEGAADVEALRAAYADKIAAVRRSDAVVGEDGQERETATTAETTNPPGTASAAAAAAAASSSSSPASGARPLTAFLDVEKARELPAEELTAVWRLRFAADTHSLCAVIPAATYAAMAAAAHARPQFVLPVPHPTQGAEMHFLQWTFDAATQSSTILFTQLAEFKLRGEYAQPHTTLTHHTELAASSGVVLMQGQVTEGRGATVDNARWLAMCLQRFYGAWAAGDDEGARRRRQLVQWFAAGDPQFSVEQLMDEVEKLG